MDSATRIKLIVSDVDGTLVDSQKRLPPGFSKAVRKLREHGVRFVIASGRQYYNVLKTFDCVRDDILVLPDNGAMLIENDEAYYTNRMSAEDVADILRAVEQIPTAHPLLEGVRALYLRPGSDFYEHEVARYYERRVVAHDAFEQAASDTICKVAIFDDVSSAQNIAPVVAHFSDHLTVTLSGDNWLDIMNKGVDKGSGLRIILDHLGLMPDECMAFGDYDNDIQMLKICGESYAMANATDAVKAVCRHLAPSNEEAGVMQVLRREFPFLND